MSVLITVSEGQRSLLIYALGCAAGTCGPGVETAGKFLELASMVARSTSVAPADSPEPVKLGGTEATRAVYAPPAKSDVWVDGLKPADKNRAESLSVDLLKCEQKDLDDGTFRAKFSYSNPAGKGALNASLFGDESLATKLRDRCGKPGKTLLYITRSKDNKYTNIVGASL